MVFSYEVRHVLQDVLFFFACAVWCHPSLAFPHAHSAPGGMEPQANIPAETSRGASGTS